MIKKCIQQWGKHEQDYYLSKLERVLLTIKAVIAICLRLEHGGKVDAYEKDYVCIAILESGTFGCEWGTCGWYTDIQISKHWNEWRYIVGGDSWP
jgi:hypothetical protein